MLKRDITYTDFEDKEHTETFYFNISKPELIELEVEVEGGLGDFLAKIIKEMNGKELIKYFKQIVLMAYGVKSDDGKRFIKSDQLREEFSQTAAYNALFMELATDDGAAADFLRGVLPRDMVNDIDAVPTAPLPEMASAPPAPPST